MAPLNVITVSGKVLRRELPVARHDELVHAANDLDTAFIPVEKGVEIPGHFAKILAQRRRLGVEGGEPQSLVALELRHWHQTPALAVEFAMIGLLQVRHAGELPVIAIGPAVIGAGEAGGVSGLGAAQPIAAMTADIEEGMDLPGDFFTTSTGSSPM